MTKYPHHDGDNVTKMPGKPSDGAAPVLEFPGPAPAANAVPKAGGPEDPRMKEALRLVEAFLAIEDPAARAALVTLADRMVSHDWLRTVQKR